MDLEVWRAGRGREKEGRRERGRKERGERGEKEMRRIDVERGEEGRERHM